MLKLQNCAGSLYHVKTVLWQKQCWLELDTTNSLPASHIHVDIWMYKVRKIVSREVFWQYLPNGWQFWIKFCTPVECLSLRLHKIAEFYQLSFTLKKLCYINRGHCQKSSEATFCRTLYITARRYIQGDTPNILSTIWLYLLSLYSVIIKSHRYAKALYMHSRNIAISRSRHFTSG